MRDNLHGSLFVSRTVFSAIQFDASAINNDVRARAFSEEIWENRDLRQPRRLIRTVNVLGDRT